MAMDYAAAVNEELRDIIAAGVDVVQLDEPWMQARADRAARYGVRGAEPRARRHRRRRRPCTCASATPRWCPTNRPRTRSCPSWPIPPRGRSRSKRRSPISTSVFSPICRTSRSCSACSICRAPVAETAEQVAERIRKGLKYVAPERLVAAPDCGMKYLSRDLAFAKLSALAAGAAIVRKELAG